MESIIIQSSRSKIKISGFTVKISRMDYPEFLKLLQNLRHRNELVSFVLTKKYIHVYLAKGIDALDVPNETDLNLIKKICEEDNGIQLMSSITLKTSLQSKSLFIYEKEISTPFYLYSTILSITNLSTESFNDIHKKINETQFTHIIYTQSFFEDESGSFFSIMVFGQNKNDLKLNIKSIQNELSSSGKQIAFERVSGKFMRKNPIRFQLGFTNNPFLSDIDLFKHIFCDSITSFDSGIPRERIEIKSISPQIQTRNSPLSTIIHSESYNFVSKSLSSYGWIVQSNLSENKYLRFTSQFGEIKTKIAIYKKTILEFLQINEFEFNSKQPQSRENQLESIFN